MILTESNYNIEIPLVSPISSQVCESYRVVIKVWNGDISAVPLVVDYEKIKFNPEASSGTQEVNIARLLSDFIDFKSTKVTTTNVSNSGTNNAYAQIEVFYTVAGVEEVTPTVETHLISKGYSYAVEDEQLQFPTNNVLLNGRKFTIAKGGTAVVPVVGNGLNVSIKSYPSLQLNQVISVPTSTSSASVVKYVNIKTQAETTDTYIEVIYNGETIRFDIIDECVNTPYDIYFCNKWGATQVIPFFKIRKDSISIESEKYEAYTGRVALGNHHVNKYNFNGKSKFTLVTGYVPESMNIAFKEMLLSHKIWVLENDKLIPVNCSENSFEYKTRTNDSLISYTIGFEYAFNEIDSY